LIKNSQPFGKKFQKTIGGGIFLTHTVYGVVAHMVITGLGISIHQLKETAT